MRSMSFILTKPQILARTKTVTRRVGWLKLKPGDRLWGVEKAQGLKKGEKVKLLRVIEVVSARRERLDDLVDSSRPDYGREEMVLEGFPGLDPQIFMLRYFQTIDPDELVSRIEFRYLD